MIAGKLNLLDLNQVKYPEIINKALAYLQAKDFNSMADGRYQIDGDDCVAIVQRYQTKPAAICHPEVHKKFIDIQFIAAGEEYIGWCPLSSTLQVMEEYNADKDIAFYDKLVEGSKLYMTAGSYAVLYPEDVHQPCMAVGDVPGAVTKVVVKIAVAAAK